MSVCNLYLVTEVSSVLLEHYRRPLWELSDNDIQFCVMLLYLCIMCLFSVNGKVKLAYFQQFWWCSESENRPLFPLLSV